MNELKRLIEERVGRVRANAYLGKGGKITFFWDGVLNQDKTSEKGRPQYDLIEMIKIVTPAKRDPVIGVVTDEHRMKYSEAYEAFISQNKKAESGTLLKEWSLLPKNKCLELTALGVQTVEELAECEFLEDYKDEILLAQGYLKDSDAPKNQIPLLKKKIKDLESKLNIAEEQLLILQDRLKVHS